MRLGEAPNSLAIAPMDIREGRMRFSATGISFGEAPKTVGVAPKDAAVWAKQAVAFGHLAQLVRPALVNGAIGVVMAPRGRLSRALTFKIANGKITEIEVIGDQARLGELDVSIVD